MKERAHLEIIEDIFEAAVKFAAVFLDGEQIGSTPYEEELTIVDLVEEDDVDTVVLSSGSSFPRYK